MSSATSPSNLASLIESWADQMPAAFAIGAPGRPWLSYRGLRDHLLEVGDQLNERGLGRGDRIALVLPQGPEMATAFLAVAAAATCAPLNPAYRAAELDRYLADLKARAVIWTGATRSPVEEVARARGILSLELRARADAPAGLFTLSGPARRSRAASGPAGPQDLALVMHTSGSTARPKLVTQTHSNLCGAAGCIVRSLQLTPRDRSINVMPMFHIHALVVALLASLAAGGSILCPPGFDPSEFFAWLRAYRPTWYSAAPTLHHAILDGAHQHRQIAAEGSLRLIRSSAAALPAQLLAGLEDAFKVPVIEGYGMTECPLIASNPLPPGPRKIGSVGRAAGAEIAILDPAGRALPAGEEGEIVVRGVDCVIGGYEDNPQADRESFTQGWFRTGDSGYLDGDGYLFIRGRLKEIINRGGQKISPAEVEAVILDHPAVCQAAAFALPHPRLGEDLAAAVVLHANCAATEQEIRRFAAARMADFKVPGQVWIVDRLPKGPTGKVQRLKLAQQLGLQADSLPEPAKKPAPCGPHDSKIGRIAGIWAQVLQRGPVGRDDNFFQLGGDSILATLVVSRLRKEFQIDLPLRTVFEAPTVAALAELIDRIPAAGLPAAPLPAQFPIPAASVAAVETPGGSMILDRSAQPSEMRFSLFFFSADGSTTATDKYRLFRESVRFADQHGFEAVWTPERHFHPFGGLYPNPALLGAAMAAMTERIGIRAGSVVLPLQDPVRVAEEWALVDNLSGGRVGIACASGWHANDFVLSPGDYAARKHVMFERIDILERLWRGESIALVNGAGKEVEIRTFPRPLQPRLPLWIASHSDDSFIRAGEMGASVLTALYSTTVEDLERQIGLYRQALVRGGRDPKAGAVTLMVHTFLAENEPAVQEKLRSAYGEYLFVFLGLQAAQARGLDQEFDLTEADKQFIVEGALQRRAGTRDLIGTPAECAERVEQFRRMGVDEIACLIDFGIDFESVMTSLHLLDRLKTLCNSSGQQRTAE